MRGLKSRLFLSLRLYMRRIAHAVRGLKCVFALQSAHDVRRIAHAVRGLKFLQINLHLPGLWSHCSRGAWIEILNSRAINEPEESHCSRGAWIEIITYNLRRIGADVALLTRCVD